MSDDYLDRIGDLLPADVFQSYVKIKVHIAERRDELRVLEEELFQIGRHYGVPDIDDPSANSNASIQQALGANSVEINSVWTMTPPSWRCPCCGRAKPECARLGTKGQMLGKLVAHHDHIEDFMDVVLSDLSTEMNIEATSSADARRFIRRGIDFFTRFDRIVICEDCNNAEASAKLLVDAAQHFTFTPREIATFVLASHNRPHEVDEMALASAFAQARPLYDRRVISLRRLAEQALRGAAWYEPVAFDDLEDQIIRRAQQALQIFGLRDAGHRTLNELFFPSRKIGIKHAPAWRLRTASAPRLPNESEIAFVTRGNLQYQQLPEDWTCPCCARRKQDTIRWSQNSKQFIFVLHTRNIPDSAAPYGKRKIVVCDACGHIFRECSKELRMVLGGQAVPDYPVNIDVVRAIIRPKPHSMHEVDAEAARSLVDTLLSRFTHE